MSVLLEILPRQEAAERRTRVDATSNSGYQSGRFLLRTPMTNPRVPPEISDYIVDLLHGDPETLKQCCVVSKSWVPCARKYIFKEVRFNRISELEAWRKAFPDLANSPAYYTHSLYIGCAEAVNSADAKEGGWIRGFASVVRLVVCDCTRNLLFPSS